MIKSIVLLGVFATGSTLPAVQEIQPVKEATINVSQFSLNWGGEGFEAKLTPQTDFALKLKLTGDKIITLQF
ncbi:hypothetical protein DES40_1953 [Litorimonas taeanensis]|uniref:Uncharacterized protein n=1 Tax=Litorimonas taeanensis TaxID=568099 RepID=A0A420WDV3_9PROT|nr:hypothetical protein [Litorimonas taeanensis]RKQ69166.1 hypothetical protein DES40_1953 [Litorimonas taeanensis]